DTPSLLGKDPCRVGRGTHPESPKSNTPSSGLKLAVAGSENPSRRRNDGGPKRPNKEGKPEYRRSSGRDVKGYGFASTPTSSRPRNTPRDPFRMVSHSPTHFRGRGPPGSR